MILEKDINKVYASRQDTTFSASNLHNAWATHLNPFSMNNVRSEYPS